MKEKERIEKATAEGFLRLYNGYYRTTFEIVELSDAPDVRCQDSDENELNLEITLTQDRDKDIQALLGRSDHKSIQALEEHNKRVAEGKENPISSSLSENLLNTHVNVKVILGNARLSLRQFLNMDVGDHIPLEQQDDKPINVFIQNVPKFEGYQGAYKGKRAVKLSKLLYEPRAYSDLFEETALSDKELD